MRAHSMSGTSGPDSRAFQLSRGGSSVEREQDGDFEEAKLRQSCNGLFYIAIGIEL